MNRCFATIWAAEIVLSFQIENVLRPNVSGSKMAHPLMAHCGRALVRFFAPYLFTREPGQKLSMLVAEFFRRV